MPLYDFRCPRCRHEEERLVRDSEVQIECPQCLATDDLGISMDKLIAAPSFQIKGLRAANGYGLKFMDTYGKSPVNGKETGCTFNSNRGSVVDHNFAAKDDNADG
jgi:putative FmdB family regulatory protein